MGKHNSTLRSKDIKDLKEITSFDEDEIREWYKGFLNDNPSGYITKEQFMQMYRGLFPHGDPTPFAQHVFRIYDTDGDGKVDFREFLFALSVSSRGTFEQKMRMTFSMYDLDGSGYTTRDEILEVVKSIYLLAGDKLKTTEDLDTPEKRTDYILQKFDSNRDGKLSIEEFIMGARHEPAVLSLLECVSQNSIRYYDIFFNVKVSEKEEVVPKKMPEYKIVVRNSKLSF